LSDSLEHEIRTLRAHFWSDRDPDGRAFAPLAEAYLTRGDLDEALALVVDGLGRLPDFATGHLVAARVHRARGDGAAARQAVEALLALDGGSAPGLRLLGEMAEEAGQTDRAVSAFREALARDPGYADLEGRIARLAHPTHPSAPSPAEMAEADADEGDAVEPVGAVDGASPEDPAPAEPGDLHVEGFESFEPFSLPEASPAAAADEVDPAAEGASEGGIPEEAVPEEMAFDMAMDEEAFAVAPDREGSGLQVDPPELGAGLEVVSERDPSEGVLSTPVPLASPGSEFAPDPSPPLVTRTMAELYVRQGFIDRAVDVYRQLVERDPGDDGIRRRLAELEARETEEPSERAPQWSPEPGAALDRSADSPFAWAPHEHPDEAGEPTSPEEAGRGPTAGEYFRDLLAWEAGAVPIASLAPRSEQAGEEGHETERAPDPIRAPLPPEDDDPFLQLPPDDGSWGR
jgi:tetratricopeptide (TPR) repeat protein